MMTHYILDSHEAKLCVLVIIHDILALVTWAYPHAINASLILLHLGLGGLWYNTTVCDAL